MDDSLEDRIRRMVLLNDSVPDDTISNRPTVRLPPASTTNVHRQQTSINGKATSSPHNQGFSLSNTMNPTFAAPAHLPPPGMRQMGPRQNGNHAGPTAYAQTPAPQAMPPARQAQYGHHGVGRGNGPSRQQQQRYQQLPLDPNAFQRGPPTQHPARPQQGARNLFDPNARTQTQGHAHPYTRQGIAQARQRQVDHLEQLAAVEIYKVDMPEAEKSAKESFRADLQKVCRQICQENRSLPAVSLECFGSFQSGFASAGSDMDLVIVVQDANAMASCFSLLEHDLPRTLEKKLLESGFGARLLTRTRVPIIKVCQSPADDFLGKLREEREKWNALPDEQKYPHLYPEDQVIGSETAVTNGAHPEKIDTPTSTMTREGAVTTITKKVSDDAPAAPATPQEPTDADALKSQQVQKSKRDQPKSWLREKKPGPLDFPNEGVGIQCDINFFNPLGLHNTQMLRCYSMCDPRVRPMVLFVKSWAKQRKINSSYSGTLSSYGYVLMVLHYLMNVARPPVLPNLQMAWRPQGCTPSSVTRTEVDGWTVDFWRNEEEIQNAVRKGQMSSNRDSLGSLLADFFQYYSSMGQGPQFRWTQQVLSLRTEHGILTKEAKGWVKAQTEEGEGKKIQHRYLFCIEDPFELAHNVARTVTHNGIVAIRDEFRRAYRILQSIGNGHPANEGPLFAKLVEDEPEAAEASASKATTLTGSMPAAQLPTTTTHNPDANSTSRPINSLPRAPPINAGILPPSTSQSASTSSRQSSIDISSSSSFPTLGSASANSAGRRKKSATGNFAAIEGNAAQAYLDEYRRKKAEEQAESTAMGAAEAVLGDD
ncbi:unnamed protein product [Zymoseptoria tritici ST99CH_1A5]|uniref:polynucleotide adenylyltransferase n=1 Tax=Zymoseptoria tritici ST99CH_1A5 TaxID=1276529 RepID=A0A1Y6LAQ8_ZYMTR|nr:unnamed protein product [Zymoseptoria tritici ST99CH_1A5]